jgi:hypothetical protein
MSGTGALFLGTAVSPDQRAAPRAVHARSSDVTTHVRVVQFALVWVPTT